MKDCDGVIICYDPVLHTHEQEVQLWFEWFVKNCNLDERQQCLVLALSAGVDRPRGRVQVPRAMQSVAFLPCTFSDSKKINDEFQTFLQRIVKLKGAGNNEKRK